jgi:xanthosine utilization system XapX-like protein
VTTIIAFMNNAIGRTLRLVLGVALAVYGLLVLRGTAGTVVAVVGLLPIVLGLWAIASSSWLLRVPAHRVNHHWEGST